MSKAYIVFYTMDGQKIVILSEFIPRVGEFISWVNDDGTISKFRVKEINHMYKLRKDYSDPKQNLYDRKVCLTVEKVATV